MFTGDGGFGGDEAENRALASGLDLSADVLKVGHHGSGGSSSREFLAAVGAKYGLSLQQQTQVLVILMKPQCNG